MKKIGIITDSASDFPKNLAQENDVTIVHYKVDMQEIEQFPGNIYEKIKEAEKRGISSFIKTSQPSIQDFLSAFKENLQNFEKIIYISLSAKISGAFNSASQAKKFLGKDAERIHIVDSEFGSGGQTFLILRALEAIKENLNIDEVLEKIRENIKKTTLIGMYEDAKWLQKSGRIPVVSMGLKAAQRMKIKPVLKMTNGQLKPYTIKRNVESIAQSLFEEFNKFTKGINSRIEVMITHASNLKEAQKLKELIDGLNNKKVIILEEINIAVGGHVGPGTIVLVWNKI